MKKNGFISTAMAYTFLIVFAFLLLSIIRTYNNSTILNKDISTQAKEDLANGYTFFNPGTCTPYNLTANKRYRIELWGADGGSFITPGADPKLISGGIGGFTSGEIKPSEDTTIYVCVGKAGTTCTTGECAGGYNGGGKAVASLGSYPVQVSSGGGATDVRLYMTDTNDLNNTASLASRIMVAGGGGGGAYQSETNYGLGGSGGGLTGLEGTGQFKGSGGLQVSSAELLFGQGGDAGALGSNNYGGGGGGGYYGGQGAKINSANILSGGGGGSSYISGYLGCIAVESQSDLRPRKKGDNSTQCTTLDMSKEDVICSQHYSELFFSKTIMVDGTGGTTSSSAIPVPEYNSSNTNILGDGAARIYEVNDNYDIE